MNITRILEIEAWLLDSTWIFKYVSSLVTFLLLQVRNSRVSKRP